MAGSALLGLVSAAVLMLWYAAHGRRAAAAEPQPQPPSVPSRVDQTPTH